MTFNNATTEQSDNYPDHHYRMFLNVYIVVYLLLALTGIATNCINLVVFKKMGLAESVTISFFILSLIDLGVTVSGVMSGMSLCLLQIQSEFGIWFGIDPWVLRIFSINTMASFVGGSILLTTYLAIQRCCCVALPFAFKRIFTKNFTLCVLTVVGMITLVLVSLFTSMYTTELKPVLGKNFSTIQLVAKPLRAQLIQHVLIFRLFCMTVGCEVIVLFCLVVMIFGLRRSAEFRQKSTTGDPGIGDSTSSSQSLSERRLVKTIILISALFVTCNSPSLVYSLMLMVDRGFGAFVKLSNSEKTVHAMMNFLEVGNSTLNLFIYYKSNTKFNKLLRELLRS